MHFNKRIFRIKICEPITHKLLPKIRDALGGWHIHSPAMVALVVNSPGGELVQAKRLVQFLRDYSSQHNALFYSFGEDMAVNSAMALLTAGSKCFVNPYAIVGDIGFICQRIGLREFSKYWLLDHESIASGKNGEFMSPFAEFDAQQRESVQRLLRIKQEELINEIERNRALRLSPLDIQVRVRDVYEKGLLTAEELRRARLVDGFESLDEVAHNEFKGMKVASIYGKK